MNERKFRVIQPGWYLGFSAEAGNVFDESQEIALDDLLVSGSLFAGLDTPIGPFLLGYGLTEGGRSRVYFSLGVGLWR
jgi:NTE family protein